MLRWSTMVMTLLLVAACKPRSESLTWELVAEHAHDAGCYTQGLEFHEGALLESGGQYGESNVRRVDPKTGKVIKQRDFPASVFAEGVTVMKGQLWMLTWENGTVYVLDPQSFELIARHSYKGEGWGIAHDGEQLIMSDGSSKLTLRSPKDFSVLGEIEVTRKGKAQLDLNELEYLDGAIYANVYQADEILRIDAKSGVVTGVLDLSDLRERLVEEEPLAEELNGIALHPETGHLWVTGKYWPTMFEIKVLSP